MGARALSCPQTAGTNGGALEQIHIFALSHILRRPIIVYGVKYIKNYRDEPIGIANFQGIYIPLLWERNFCSPNPIVLGYTRGHFTALVPMEPQPISIDGQVSPSANSSPFTSPRIASSSSSRKHSPTPPDDSTAVCVTTPVSSPSTESQLMSVSESLLSSNTTSTTLQNSFIYLPLVDRQGGLLPIHFTTEKEANLSQTLLRDWLDVVSTPRGLPLARLRLGPRHPLVDRMTEEWLDSYRSLARFSVPTTSFPSGSLMINPSRDSEKSSSSSSLCSESDVIEKPEPSECHHKPAS
ncbi:unnamed protein product [Calicophoron daubneyi]|uniref:ubiquitinyl hydrolase 1 n=1 Tax=Calicophoron daubneyi TaxID=300641 RepID=A0AAV2T224_CALDB